MDGSPRKSKAPPLSQEKLREMALRYVGRYAASEAKLAGYLTRKLRERGWTGEYPADPQGLAREFADLGYVDDAALAGAKSRASVRKGHGTRRLSQDLHHAGISEDDAREALEEADENAWAAADNFARKRRIGPYADEQADKDKRRKQFAAFMRAGHDFDVARKYVEAMPGDVVEE